MTKKSARVPFSPRRWPFFYGWVILAAGTIGFIFSVPGQTIGVSAFTRPLMEALHLQSTTISLAYMLGTLASASLLTRAGRFFDRMGARVTAAAAGAGLGLILLYMSQARGITRALEPLLPGDRERAAAFSVLVVGFFLLRFFGQGVLTMASSNMVMKWFRSRRGLASGIMNVFTPVGFSLAPRLFNSLQNQVGWSTTWVYTALVLGLGFPLFVVIFYRDNPEECGLQPDGAPSPQDTKAGQDHEGQDYTLSEARRTYPFWAFNLALAMNALYVTAMTFHIESIFLQAGRMESEAFGIFFPISLGAVLLGLVAGWISDHTKLKYLLLTMTLGMLTSMAGLLLLEHGPGYEMIIFGNALSRAMFGLLLAITWPHFFGRTHLGAITGFQRSWTVSFSALGPYLFSLSLEHLGSYTPSILFCAAVTGVLFVAALSADKPIWPAPGS